MAMSWAQRQKRAKDRALEKLLQQARFVSEREEAITDFCIEQAVSAYMSAVNEVTQAIERGSPNAKRIAPPDPVELAKRFRELYLRETK